MPIGVTISGSLAINSSLYTLLRVRGETACAAEPTITNNIAKNHLSRIGLDIDMHQEF
jgi:hypothetical protein